MPNVDKPCLDCKWFQLEKNGAMTTRGMCNWWKGNPHPPRYDGIDDDGAESFYDYDADDYTYDGVNYPDCPCWELRA